MLYFDISITFASTELTFANNNDGGVEDIVTNLTPFVSKYNITPGDLIYFASAVGISNCPGAPKLTFLAGRPDPTGPAPDGTVNSPTGKQYNSSGAQNLSDLLFLRYCRCYPYAFWRSWIQF